MRWDPTDCIRLQVGADMKIAAGIVKAPLCALVDQDVKCFMLVLQIINQMADRHKYGTVRDMIGHGVGTVFHSQPAIFHHRNREPGNMVPWQTFTIEPILTAGDTRHRTWKDKWTMVTKDGKRAAQCEHTILITDKGHEVLTRL